MNKEEITRSNLRKLRETVDPSWLTLSQPSNSHQEIQEHEQDHVSHSLNLSLSLSPMAKRKSSVTPPLIQKEPCVPPLFLWATSEHTTEHTLDYFGIPFHQPSNSHQEIQEQEQDHVSHSLNLSLSLSPMTKHQRINLPSPYPTIKQPRRSLMIQKESTVPPPFPWATSKRATVHTLDHLKSKLNLKTVSGTLVCQYCKFEQNIQFDLDEKFNKVKMFIEENRHRQEMRNHLAPDAWMSPEVPRCKKCSQKSMQPLITKKRNINWLFLMLGQLIGCCKLVHLKYFCKHADEIKRRSVDTNKDRLVYLTYIGLCKQLVPEGQAQDRVSQTLGQPSCSHIAKRQLLLEPQSSLVMMNRGTARSSGQAFVDLPKQYAGDTVSPPWNRPVKMRRIVSPLKFDQITPPFPWAAAARAKVHRLDYLLSALKLREISGAMVCKFCAVQQNNVKFDLVSKFLEVKNFMLENRHEMYDRRAPDAWLNPVLPRCDNCGKEEAMKPLITKKRNINWLFLLLGQLVGCCTIEHLRYFCKYTNMKIFKSNTKDRLLYLVYLGLCKQVQPGGPFKPYNL